MCVCVAALSPSVINGTAPTAKRALATKSMDAAGNIQVMGGEVLFTKATSFQGGAA